MADGTCVIIVVFVLMLLVIVMMMMMMMMMVTISHITLTTGDIITLGDLEYELHCPPSQLAGSLPSTRLPLDAPPAAGPPYCLAEVCDVWCVTRGV